MSKAKQYQDLYDSFTRSRKLDDDDSTWTAAQRAEFQLLYENLQNGATKAIRPELKRPASQGVPSIFEVERALSRLAILPNPPEPWIEDIDKYVESPWTLVDTFTIDPNLWDDAVLATIKLEDLFATDPFLSRKKVRKHIENMGQALTPNRHYALIAMRDEQAIIVDGHHRLMAQWLLGQDKAAAWVITLKGKN